MEQVSVEQVREISVSRKGDWIQTYTGKQFWPIDPKPEEVDIEDISHALSQLCRFTGHSSRFYSVAEHSVAVSYEVPKDDALWALMHDASEAYLLDLAKPVKMCPEMAGYRILEDGVQAAICKRFGLQSDMPSSVKEADLRMLATEMRDVMASPPASWGLDKVVPYKLKIKCWKPKKAKFKFLTRFVELTTQQT